MSELVTIAVYTEGHRAQCARMLLEREGIPCFLADEFLSALGRNLYTPAGGVRLQVVAEAAGEAERLLRAEGILEGGENTRDDGKPGPCPHCGGTNVVCRPVFVILSLLLFFPFQGARYRCKTCGRHWR